MENQKPKDQDAKKTKKKTPRCKCILEGGKNVKKSYLWLICVLYVNVESHFVQNTEALNLIIVK